MDIKFIDMARCDKIIGPPTIYTVPLLVWRPDLVYSFMNFNTNSTTKFINCVPTRITHSKNNTPLTWQCAAHTVSGRYFLFSIVPSEDGESSIVTITP